MIYCRHKRTPLKSLNTGPPAALTEFVGIKLPNNIKFGIRTITEEQIVSSLMSLNMNKATGIDDISAKYIGIATPVLARHLCKIINISISSGIFLIYGNMPKFFQFLRLEIRLT